MADERKLFLHLELVASLSCSIRNLGRDLPNLCPAFEYAEGFQKLRPPTPSLKSIAQPLGIPSGNGDLAVHMAISASNRDRIERIGVETGERLAIAT